MNWSDFVTPAYMTMLIGLVGWLLKRRMDRQDTRAQRMEDKQDAYLEGQKNCQIANEQRFSTWDQHNKLADKVENHGQRISALEARRQ